MNKYQNMKIEINEQQPLDEVMRELERLGFKNVNLGWEATPEVIFVDCEDKCFCYTVDHDDIGSTTLTQLKEMEN